MVSRLFEFDDWKEIMKVLEEIFNTEVILKPIFPENALLKLEEGSIVDLLDQTGVWKEMGPFHLLFKKWNKFNHGRPLLMKGYGSWLKIKDLPLDYWCRRTFKQ